MGDEYLNFLKKDKPKKLREEELLNEDANISDIEPIIKDEDLKEMAARLDLEIELEMERSEDTRLLMDESVGAAMGGAIGGLIAAGPIIAWAAKKFRDVYGKANEACGKLGGKEGVMCRKQYKMKAAKAEISALKYARSKCGQAADRKACIGKINAKIKELQNKYPETQFKD